MQTQQQIALGLLGVSMINIFWSTLLQEKKPWDTFTWEWRRFGPMRAFFGHPPVAGSVCYFGIVSGILILIFNAIQLSLAIRYVREKKTDALRTLLKVSIALNVIIFVLMLLMNSFAIHYFVLRIHFKMKIEVPHGLFDNSIIYFIAQFTAIKLLYSPS